MRDFRPHASLIDPQVLFKRPSEIGDEKYSTQNADSRRSDRPTANQITALAIKLSVARARRAAHLSPSLFGEPGWDMLLALFNAEAAGYRMTVTSLCTASHAPPTTALRWITALREQDMILRTASPQDGRIVFIELRPAAREAITAYIKDLWSGLFAAD